MTALDECHARGFMWKAMGMCTNLKSEVNKCLRAERLERTAENREKAKAKKEKIQAIWAEIDANS
jgi:COX assembly protein 2